MVRALSSKGLIRAVMNGLLPGRATSRFANVACAGRIERRFAVGAERFHAASIGCLIRRKREGPQPSPAGAFRFHQTRVRTSFSACRSHVLARLEAAQCADTMSWLRSAKWPSVLVARSVALARICPRSLMAMHTRRRHRTASVSWMELAPKRRYVLTLEPVTPRTRRVAGQARWYEIASHGGTIRNAATNVIMNLIRRVGLSDA